MCSNMKTRFWMCLYTLVGLLYGGAFAQDAYIETTGRGYVSTGYYANERTKVEIDFQVTEKMSNAAICGGWNGGATSFGVYLNGAGNLEPHLGGWLGWIVLNAEIDTERRYCMVLDAPRRRVTVVYSDSNTALNTKDHHANMTAIGGTAATPLLLFANMTAAGAVDSGIGSAGRVFAFRIYEDDELVHDFTPARKGGDVGIWDAVTGAFHGGSTAVTVGGDGVRELPDDAYLEANGTQGIDTGYYASEKTRVEVDFALADVTRRDAAVFGAWDGGATTFGLKLNGSGNLEPNLGGWPGNFLNVDSGQLVNGRRFHVTLDGPGKKATVRRAGSGELLGSKDVSASWLADKITQFGGTSTESLYLFASQKAGGLNSPGYARIYSFQIYEDDTLLHDYRPSVRNAQPGFRDAVTGAFLTTATSMKWRLGVGGTVEADTRSTDAAVVFSGAQSFDTGYRAGPNSRFVVDFALTGKITDQQFVFETGGSSEDGLIGRIYLNWETAYAWTYSRAGNWTPTGVMSDHQRRLFTIDAEQDRVCMETAGETTYVNDATLGTVDHAATCTTTTKIGSDVTGTKEKNFASMRLYRFQIYEAGELVHDFVPCRDETGVGLYDRVLGALTACAGLTLDGRGLDGEEVYLAYPTDMRVSSGRTAVATVRAVGAVAYRWARNGEVSVEEETGSHVIDWRNATTPDVYTVTPVYDLFGVKTEGTAVSFSVTYAPRGMTLLIR